MTWTSKTILSLVELLLYAALLPISCYTLYKHRKPSILGHIYLIGFFGLRIAATALTVSSRNEPLSSNQTGAIINSVGLSPLLLATSGFISEARHYFVTEKKAKPIGWLFEALIHVVIVTGVALLAVGRSNAAEATTVTELNHDLSLGYAGAILLLLSWLAICAWAAWNALSLNKAKRAAPHDRLPRLLLTEILISLPFTGIRTIYSVVYSFDRSPDLNPATNTFLVYLFLVFLAQFIAALVLVVALIVTRNIGHESRTTLPSPTTAQSTMQNIHT